jgi:hypothetical protein
MEEGTARRLKGFYRLVQHHHLPEKKVACIDRRIDTMTGMPIAPDRLL